MEGDKINVNENLHHHQNENEIKMQDYAKTLSNKEGEAKELTHLGDDSTPKAPFEIGKVPRKNKDNQQNLSVTEETQPRVRIEDLRFDTIWTILTITILGCLIAGIWMIVELVLVYQQRGVEAQKLTVWLYYSLSLILTVILILYTFRIGGLFVFKAKHRISEQRWVFFIIFTAWLLPWLNPAFLAYFSYFQLNEQSIWWLIPYAGVVTTTIITLVYSFIIHELSRYSKESLGIKLSLNCGNRKSKSLFIRSRVVFFIYYLLRVLLALLLSMDMGFVPVAPIVSLFKQLALGYNNTSLFIARSLMISLTTVCDIAIISWIFAHYVYTKDHILQKWFYVQNRRGFILYGLLLTSFVEWSFCTIYCIVESIAFPAVPFSTIDLRISGSSLAVEVATVNNSTGNETQNFHYFQYQSPVLVYVSWIIIVAYSFLPFDAVGLKGMFISNPAPLTLERNQERVKIRYFSLENEEQRSELNRMIIQIEKKPSFKANIPINGDDFFIDEVAQQGNHGQATTQSGSVLELMSLAMKSVTDSLGLLNRSANSGNQYTDMEAPTFAGIFNALIPNEDNFLDIGNDSEKKFGSNTITPVSFHASALSIDNESEYKGVIVNFVLETHLRMLNFSNIVYSTGSVAKPQTNSEVQLLVEENDYQVFRQISDPKADIHCIVFVSEKRNHIVITFRGSNSWMNVKQDALFHWVTYAPGISWEYAIPEKRFDKWIAGGMPKVHAGFWKAYCTIRGALLCCVQELIKTLGKSSSKANKNLKFFCCGHSMGGSLAYLIAFDIRKKMNIDAMNIVVTTFGTARTFNSAMRYRYNDALPQTFNFVSVGDFVSQLPPRIPFNLPFGYKHVGICILLQPNGSMLVRPRNVEITVLHNMIAQSGDAHRIRSYAMPLMQWCHVTLGQRIRPFWKSLVCQVLALSSENLLEQPKMIEVLKNFNHILSEALTSAKISKQSSNAMYGGSTPTEKGSPDHNHTDNANVEVDTVELMHSSVKQYIKMTSERKFLFRRISSDGGNLAALDSSTGETSDEEKRAKEYIAPSKFTDSETKQQDEVTLTCGVLDVRLPKIYVLKPSEVLFLEITCAPEASQSDAIDATKSVVSYAIEGVEEEKAKNTQGEEPVVNQKIYTREIGLHDIESLVQANPSDDSGLHITLWKDESLIFGGQAHVLRPTVDSLTIKLLKKQISCSCKNSSATSSSPTNSLTDATTSSYWVTSTLYSYLPSFRQQMFSLPNVADPQANLCDYCKGVPFLCVAAGELSLNSLFQEGTAHRIFCEVLMSRNHDMPISNETTNSDSSTYSANVSLHLDGIETDLARSSFASLDENDIERGEKNPSLSEIQIQTKEGTPIYTNYNSRSLRYFQTKQIAEILKSLMPQAAETSKMVLSVQVHSVTTSAWRFFRSRNVNQSDTISLGWGRALFCKLKLGSQYAKTTTTKSARWINDDQQSGTLDRIGPRRQLYAVEWPENKTRTLVFGAHESGDGISGFEELYIKIRAKKRRNQCGLIFRTEGTACIEVRDIISQMIKNGGFKLTCSVPIQDYYAIGTLQVSFELLMLPIAPATNKMEMLRQPSMKEVEPNETEKQTVSFWGSKCLVVAPRDTVQQVLPGIKSIVLDDESIPQLSPPQPKDQFEQSATEMHFEDGDRSDISLAAIAGDLSSIQCYDIELEVLEVRNIESFRYYSQVQEQEPNDSKSAVPVSTRHPVRSLSDIESPAPTEGEDATPEAFFEQITLATSSKPVPLPRIIVQLRDIYNSRIRRKWISSYPTGGSSMNPTWNKVSGRPNTTFTSRFESTSVHQITGRRESLTLYITFESDKSPKQVVACRSALLRDIIKKYQPTSTKSDPLAIVDKRGWVKLNDPLDAKDTMMRKTSNEILNRSKEKDNEQYPEVFIHLRIQQKGNKIN